MERYEYSGKDHIEYCSIKIDDICFISVYNSPNSSFAVLKKYLHEVISISTKFSDKIIIVGDFNINLKITANHRFIEFMESFGLLLINKLNESSTNAKTQIDYCFSNMNDFKAGYFESLASFHKAIWISKHEALSESHLGDSDMMEVDEEFFFN